MTGGQPTILSCAIALFWCLALEPISAVAQDAPSATANHTKKSFTAVRTATPPKIDGRLDDAVWAHAVALEDFHQVDPQEFGTPSQPTILYVLYDDNAIYIGARMYDKEPDKIIANQMIHGASLRADDTLTIVLDPFLNRRSGYAFFTNANGARREAIFENVGELNFDWSTIWRVESRLDAEGWTTEIEIPFKSLNFNATSQTWGFSAVRRIKRDNEKIAWTSRNRDTDPSSLGTMTGLKDIKQGRGLDVLSSLSYTGTNDHLVHEWDVDTEPSFTAIYKVTPSLTGVLTANTDFSDAAIDDRVVNLSRFSVFFPEQRDFFLQDADIFRFGGIEGNATPFFSRRIGIDEDSGEPVQMKGGAKVTGRVGPVNIGLLDVVQSDHNVVNQSNLIVARATMNVGEQSGIGAIFTSGDPNSNDENMLAGVDFNYRSDELISNKSLNSNFWYQQTDSDGLSDKSQAYGMSFNIEGSQGFWVEGWYQAIEENFNPALGFVNRTGIHNIGSVGGYQFRFNNSWFRSITPVYYFERTTDSEWNLESQVISIQPFWIRSNSGYEYRLRIRQEKEVLVEGFEIWDGVTIDPGSYDGFRTNFWFQTPSSNVISLEGQVDVGEFYGGNRHTIRGNVNWRPNKHFFLGLGYAHNDVDLRNGDFVVRLATLRANVAFSTKWSWSNYIQYDNVDDNVGLNSQVRWNPVAGHDVVLVLNHLADVVDEWTIEPRETQGTLKVSYTLRY